MFKIWKYSVSRLKTAFKNYNVIEKAEKVMEIEKRAAPRHPGTEVKFQVLIKGNSGVKEELEKKDYDLLNRLKDVKVNSEAYEEGDQTRSRPLPQERQRIGIPTYGYQEPDVIPGGKCSLRQSLEFLAKHQNDPEKHTVEAIAESYSMKPKDVHDIVTHFRAFELFISRDCDKKVEKEVLESLGIKKVVQPLFSSKFKHLNEEISTGEGIKESKPSVGEEKK